MRAAQVAGQVVDPGNVWYKIAFVRVLQEKVGGHGFFGSEAHGCECCLYRHSSSAFSKLVAVARYLLGYHCLIGSFWATREGRACICVANCGTLCRKLCTRPHRSPLSCVRAHVGRFVCLREDAPSVSICVLICVTKSGSRNSGSPDGKYAIIRSKSGPEPPPCIQEGGGAGPFWLPHVLDPDALRGFLKSGPGVLNRRIVASTKSGPEPPPCILLCG